MSKGCIMVVKNRQNKNEIVLTAKDKDFLRGYSVNGLTIIQKKFLCVFYVRLCNVSQSCRALGISRQTFYRWCKGYKSDSFSMAVKEVEESLFDDVESIMYEKIFVNKDSQMLIHFSKTKMKSRGYIETVENKMSKQLLNQVKLLTNEELDAEKFRLNES
jgi:thiaminase